MPGGLEQCLLAWIETFQSRLPLDPTLDLQSLWLLQRAESGPLPALEDPWGAVHRPDWAARGLIIWPRGRQELRLRLRLPCPEPCRTLGPGRAVARLCLRWWAEAMELRVDGEPVHGGDLFDTACRWPLPERWWAGEPLELELGLRSPCHDDGALIHSRLELEPRDPADPDGLLAPTLEALAALRRQRGVPEQVDGGSVQVLGHAHLDLAWLWPVADTWRAAERTFSSALALMERFPQLHFGHSTPALYAWLERQRPTLFQRIRAAMRAGRWEPLNGPWVESDCVLIDTASLLRQFQEGQHYSRRSFPEWDHNLAWLPDSFGFAAGLPAVAAATGVGWFCTHKLAWNATNPFPHRLFRWRSRCGSEVLALMTAPIGTDGDPLPIETYRLDWQRVTGLGEALWLPGVGDHGGGPTAEMLEQLALWQQQPQAVPQRHGSLRAYLERLEPLAPQLPVWRDELYLELHRGCATSRPDQKRHNRTLERLLREAELTRSLRLAWGRAAGVQGTGVGAGGAADTAIDWQPLLFQQFHDILPGTSIPEVFEQAEPQWRSARRRSRSQRDRDLQALLAPKVAEGPPLSPGSDQPIGGVDGASTVDPLSDPALVPLRDPFSNPGQPPAAAEEIWWSAQLQPLPAAVRSLRLPPGAWSLIQADGQELELPAQAAAEGGVWIQLPLPAGVAVLALRRRPSRLSLGKARPQALSPVQRATVLPTVGAGQSAAVAEALSDPSAAQPAAFAAVPSGSVGQPWPADQPPESLPPLQPVAACAVEPLAADHWRLGNGLIEAEIGPAGLERLVAATGVGAGQPLLAAPLRWQRWADRGEFWDAWDLAADHRRHPLPWVWQGAPELVSAGPLAVQFRWRGTVGESPVRLELRLLAGSPWLELVLCQHWRQRHELLQLEIPLARRAERWAADTSAGVIERPAEARTPREQARWEVPAISWAAAAGLAVLLDGPQGVSATADRLSVSLLRAPTWPDPGADNGWQRQRLGLMAAPQGWRPARVPQQARRLREPLWLRPCQPKVPQPVVPRLGGGPLFPPLPDDLRLVGLRPVGANAAAASELVLSVQNEGPCRRRLELGAGWQVLERLDGLDRPWCQAGDLLTVSPWQLAFWRICRSSVPN
ncbi:MAG: glycoside hydrolase family 38 C-terminal domain-containing protein [Synechococcaceae cyanobacterium ELA739]